MSPGPERAPVRAIAHRGASRLARENTIPALEAALDRGADAVEIDVRLTSDGRPVVIHDPTLERLWGIPLTVRETSYVQLRRASPAASDGIPDLRDAVRCLARRATLILDVACPESAVACLRELALLGVHDGVAFTGDPEALCAVRAERADIELLLSWENPQPPPAALLRLADPQFVNQDARWVSADFVAWARALGRRVSCYTVNDEEAMRSLIALGVEAIISDDIATLRRVIDDTRAGDGDYLATTVVSNQ